MKSKQLAKGIDQLMDEGVAQLFVNQFNGRKSSVLSEHCNLKLSNIVCCTNTGHPAAGKASICTKHAGSKPWMKVS